MKWFNLKSKKQQQLTATLEQQRAEKLREIGTQLQNARQEQNFSLEEMVALTKISRRLLQGIEEGNLEDLPEPIYIQALIRQFADALGFNGGELAKTFPVAVAPVVTTTVTPVNRSLSLGILRPVHLYLLYIFVIVCSVSTLSQMLSRAELAANNRESQPQQKTVLQPASEKQPKAANPVTNILSHDSENQSVQIGVTLKEASWISVVADGKTQFEGVLPEGTHRVWKANEQLTVKTDNAGSVMMSVNQQEARQMGEPGKPEEVKIAAKPQS